jgi:hypothetical protein
MARRPLRAVILDNDETTGFYPTLEWMMRWMAERRLGLKDATRALRAHLEETNSFRPGLPQFLRYVHGLRQTGKIDAIIMYTNMIPGTKVAGKVNAEMLALVFEDIVGAPFFDTLIIRKGTLRPEKYMDYVLKEYNADPRDMSKIVFFDDRPNYIITRSTPRPPYIYGIKEYTWWSPAKPSMAAEIKYLASIYR